MPGTQKALRKHYYPTALDSTAGAHLSYCSPHHFPPSRCHAKRGLQTELLVNDLQLRECTHGEYIVRDFHSNLTVILHLLNLIKK